MRHWEVVDDFGDSIRIEWNGSATFNFQTPRQGEWVDYHCFTHYGIDNENDALEIALEVLAEEVQDIKMQMMQWKVEVKEIAQ
tara:strand:- start:63 stop:311 length:249 start_codon:yes stop_codon:yes gene_type:complete